MMTIGRVCTRARPRTRYDSDFGSNFSRRLKHYLSITTVRQATCDGHHSTPISFQRGLKLRFTSEQAVPGDLHDGVLLVCFRQSFAPTSILFITTRL
jgi:hypothetical protein